MTLIIFLKEKVQNFIQYQWESDWMTLANPITKRLARKNSNLSPDGFIAMYTGGLKADRGIDIIVNAAVYCPEVTFVFCWW